MNLVIFLFEIIILRWFPKDWDEKYATVKNFGHRDTSLLNTVFLKKYNACMNKSYLPNARH